MAIVLTELIRLLSGLNLPAIHAARGQDTTRSRIGPWMLIVKHDSFTGSVSCVLGEGAVSVSHAALNVQFSRRLDTYDALYRLDQSPPVAWRSDAMVLAAHGANLQGLDAANPSEGLVRIPLGRLTGATRLWIRPAPGAQPRVFKLAGLQAALASATAAGCGPDFESQTDADAE